MQDILNDSSQMVGKIYWDAQAGKYDIDNKRPAFKKFVRRYMNTGQNRCHSISFYLLSVLMCDFANFLPTVNAFQAAVTHMELTFGTGIAAVNGTGIPIRIRNTYINQLINYGNKLRTGIGNAQTKDQVENPLSQFLSHLNSCPFNLRYPGNPGANWNQAVGECFDPKMWCYADAAGNVVSDDRSLNVPGVPLLQYCQTSRFLLGRSPAVGAGFYVLSQGDGYLLARMFDLARQGFLSAQYLASPQLEIATSITGQGGTPYLASSSNMYAVQQPDPYQSNVYYWHHGQWQLF